MGTRDVGTGQLCVTRNSTMLQFTELLDLLNDYPIFIPFVKRRIGVSL